MRTFRILEKALICAVALFVLETMTSCNTNQTKWKERNMEDESHVIPLKINVVHGSVIQDSTFIGCSLPSGIDKINIPAVLEKSFGEFPSKDVLESYHEIRYVKRYCPKCGSYGYIKGYFRSPSWTWQRLCGREGWLSVCPYCFSQFDFVMTAMN